MKKKFLALALALVMLLALVPVVAQAETYSDYCGDPAVNEGKDVTWSLNTETGVLTISGNGAMANNYTPPGNGNPAPWKVYADSIEFVVIENGVTSIGNFAFFGCSSLTTVEIPSSVESIGTGAFTVCTLLNSVVIPNSVKSIGGSAFNGCSGLTSVTIPSSVTSIAGVFGGCSGVTSITVSSAQLGTLLEQLGTSTTTNLTEVTVLTNSSDPTLDQSLVDGYMETYLDDSKVTFKEITSNNEVKSWYTPPATASIVDLSGWFSDAKELWVYVKTQNVADPQFTVSTTSGGDSIRKVTSDTDFANSKVACYMVVNENGGAHGSDYYIGEGEKLIRIKVFAKYGKTEYWVNTFDGDTPVDGSTTVSISEKPDGYAGYSMVDYLQQIAASKAEGTTEKTKLTDLYNGYLAYATAASAYASAFSN